MLGHISMQSDGHSEFAQGLERLMDLDLAAIHVEALLLEGFRDVARGNRAKELIVFAGTALKRNRDSLELLGKRFGSSLLLGGAAHRRSLHLLDDRLVALGGFDGQLARQQEVA